MANRVESGSINGDAGTFIVDGQGRVLTVQIVGDFEGTISFEGRHDGEPSWTAVTLPSLGGTGTSPSSTGAAAEFRGAAPYYWFRCVGSEWVSGTAFIHITIEDPDVLDTNTATQVYKTLADGVTEAGATEGVYLGIMPRSYGFTTTITEGVPDVLTYVADLQGSIDGQVWVTIVALSLTADDVADGGVLVNTSIAGEPWFTWVRVLVGTLTTESGEDDPVLSYSIQAYR